MGEAAVARDAVARLQQRWGAGVIQRGVGVATARRAVAPVRSSGVQALDALLGARGLPDGLALLRGALGSGRTTLALRSVAATQAAGGAAAWIDLARAVDPLEAAARGVSLASLPIIAPLHAREAIEICGALLAADAVDLVVLDLSGARATAVRFDELERLAARARRAGATLLLMGNERAEVAADLSLTCATLAWIVAGGEVIGRTVQISLGSGPRAGSSLRWSLYDATSAREEQRIGRIATTEVLCAPCTSAGRA